MGMRSRLVSCLHPRRIVVVCIDETDIIMTFMNYRSFPIHGPLIHNPNPVAAQAPGTLQWAETNPTPQYGKP